jgi:polysaccharide export outer membrane protein
MREMWLGRGVPAAITILLLAVSLGGCAGSLNDGKGAFGANSEFSSDGPFGSPKGTPRAPTNSGFQPVAASGGFPPAGETAPPAAGNLPPSPAVAQPAAPRSVRVAQTSGGATPGDPGLYKIGPNDVLDISVFKVPDLSKSVQVAPSGSINLPLVGEIQAAGKTTQQLERELTAQLGDKYLQNPQVTVMLKENNSQRVTIEGAVKSSGVYPLKAETSLLQLVAMAGGFDDASDSTVLILRNASGGKRSAAKFDVSAIKSGQAPDPQLQSGDVVVAGTSAIKKGFSNVLKALPLAGMFALL